MMKTLRNNFYMRIASLFFLIIIVALTGCASYLDVKVTRFHGLPNPNIPPVSSVPSGSVSSASVSPPVNSPVPAIKGPVFNGQNFGMVDEINGVENLEFKQYSRIVAYELMLMGLKEGEPKDFLVDFMISAPGNVGQRMQPQTIPYTQTNCTSGPEGRVSCAPFTGYQTNYYPVNYNYFTNTLELFLMDAKSKQRIWQGRAEATSFDQPNLLGLLPYLVKAALSNFPGPSGFTETVRFEVDKKK